MRFAPDLNARRASLRKRRDNQWESLGYPALARQFVELEIEANPDLAGPPIFELEIDDRGTVRWISRGSCPEQATGSIQEEARSVARLPRIRREKF
jgi:hypothetical protein